MKKVVNILKIATQLMFLAQRASKREQKIELSENQQQQQKYIKLFINRI